MYVITSFIFLCFLTFAIVFPKTSLFIILENFFSKSFFTFFLRPVLISIYRFRQVFWLNLITLWTFFKINPWLNACFKFIMCVMYSVLSSKLATSFFTFSIFVLSSKNGKSLWSSCNFLTYWTSTSRKHPSLLSLL